MKSSIRLAMLCLLLTGPLNAGDSKPLTILFVGDIMLDGGPGHWIASGNDPFEKCATILDSADLAIGNLECVLGKGGEQLNKAYVFRGATDSPRYLKRYFDAFSLANNHSYDFGPDGLVEMMRVLDQNKIPYFGAGANLPAARKPLVLECKGRRIGFVGYNEFRAENYAATESLAGNCPLRRELVLEEITRAKTMMKCDIVLPFMHWGEEMEEEPRPDQRELAKAMIDAGATAVIGTHPHVTQTIEHYREAPIVYSLGNFVFDYFPVDPPKWTGWMVELTFSDNNKVELKKFVVEMDLAGIPHLVATE